MRWALDGRPGRVLDPSYGGCAFLRVALDELGNIGAHDPTRLVHGTDIDGETATWTEQLMSRGVPRQNLLTEDFLALRPGDDLPLAAAVVGNPPYVRHHWMGSTATSVAVSAMRDAGVRLNGRANLWAYFVVHASKFVQPGGRLAMLLPGPALVADYAVAVREHLMQSFGQVALVRVHDRLFADAAEETIVLLASGAGESCTNFAVGDVRDLDGLERYLARWASHHPASTSNRGDWTQAISDRLDQAGQELLARLMHHPAVSSIGHLAQVRLGTVTGANSFFVCTEDEVARLGLDNSAIPIVGRSAWLRTIAIDESQFEMLSKGQARTRLLTIPKHVTIDYRTRLGRRVRAAESAGIHLRHHTQREPWWSLAPPRIPDAFLPYMIGAFKGIVKNCASATSTNTIHQLTWKSETNLAVANGATLSSWSTLTAISAELIGRPVGGGLLKIEITDSRKLLVVVQELAELERDGFAASPSETRARADAFVAASLGLRSVDLETLRDNLARLAHRRAPEKN